MVEITGGRTSLKQEGSQNVKTPKRTSRLSKQKINGHSKHSVENVCFYVPHNSQLDFEVLHVVTVDLILQVMSRK